MGWLYCIHFGDKDRFYIGATTLRPMKRRNKHLKAFRLGTHSSLLQAEWDAHGEEAFTFIPLREFPDDVLLLREAELILGSRPPLNQRPGYAVKGRHLGLHAETVKRRVAAGVPLTPARWVAQNPRKQYSCKTYDVGGRSLSIKQIAAEAGCSNELIRVRVKSGLRGPALLAKSAGRGRPRRVSS